jgi:hypothetical protein
MRILAFAVALFISGAAFAGEPVTFVITASTSVAYSTTAVTAPQTGLGTQTRVVRLVCTTDCFFAVSHPFTTLATSAPVFLPGGSVEYFRVSPGNTILVIRSTANGSLHIAELSR